MSAPVIITEAPAEVPATRVGSLADSNDLTRIAFVPGTTNRTKAGVAADVLSALGKSPDVNGKARHGYDDVSLVPIWLTAHRTTDVYAIAPQHTPSTYLGDLATMLAASPATLTLACDHGYAENLVADLAPLNPTVVPWPDLPSDWPSTENEDSGHVWDPSAREVVPDVEFLTFRATAQDLLPSAAFRAVEALFGDVLDRTLLWLTQVGPENVTEAATRAALTELLAEQVTFDEINIAVKAAQTAFFHHGWYLTVDQRELRAGMLRFPSHVVSTASWRSIRAYRDTARAATVACYLSGHSPQQIRDLTVADLAAWHADPATPLRDAPIHPEAAPYLRAHLFARISDSPTSTDPAFVGADRRVLMDLRQAGDDLGLNLGEANLAPADRHGQRRVGSRVFRLARLT